MTHRRFLVAALCLAFLAGPAAASSIGRLSPHGSTGSPKTLQQILDGLVVSGPAIDANAPADIELWLNSSGPMTARVVADATPKNRVTFGIYDPDQPNKPAFLLADFVRDAATVSFNDDSSISIRSGLQRKASGFDGPFGFFLKSTAKRQSPVFLFTEADLNGGTVQVKVFQGDNRTILKVPGQRPGLFLDSQFLIAFETGTDGGFNDFLVLVSGVVPAVPEPATFGLVGLSLAALLARRARSVV